MSEMEWFGNGSGMECSVLVCCGEFRGHGLICLQGWYFVILYCTVCDRANRADRPASRPPGRLADRPAEHPARTTPEPFGTICEPTCFWHVGPQPEPFPNHTRTTPEPGQHPNHTRTTPEPLCEPFANHLRTYSPIAACLFGTLEDKHVARLACYVKRD